MQSDGLSVFDFDGTLVKINSFKEISKRLLVKLLTKFRIKCFLTLVILYMARRLGILSHLAFKELVVNIFEVALAEQEKKIICQAVFDKNINMSVFHKMTGMNNSIICTTAPFAFMSRMSLGKEVPIISSLSPDARFNDKSNYGPAKVNNLKAYFKGENVHVVNFFTDDKISDKALIDLSDNAFIVEGNYVKKIK